MQPTLKKKSFDDFTKSPYYNAFVKFGSFLANSNPLYPDRYITWVIRSGTKLDLWYKDSLYEKYLDELLKIEPAETAIQRTVKTMLEWAEENNAAWEHYFKYVNLNRAVQHITNGLISSWVVLNCESGKAMLSNMSDDQLVMIGPFIDPKFWRRKFKENPADIALVNELITISKVP